MMEDNFIERIENEIAHQTRNGREEIYLQVEDLQKLGCKIDPNKKGRIFVDVQYVKAAIRNYKKTHFKESLKVEVNPIQKPQTYREFIKELKDKERG